MIMAQYVFLAFLLVMIATGGAVTYDVITGKNDGTGFVAMQFFPQAVSISVGDSVRFLVQGDGHTIVFYKELVGFIDFPTLVMLPSSRVQGNGTVLSSNVMYSSGLLEEGGSYSFTFPVAGM